MNIALLFAVGGIALVDSLNPSLFLAQFYLLTTTRPVPRILSYIAGVLTVNFIGGVFLFLGVQAMIANFFGTLSPLWLYGIGGVLGIGLIIFGLWMPLAGQIDEPVRQPHSLHPFHTFILGAVVMVNELTTALPYFIAIEQIASSGVSIMSGLALLIMYNLVFALPLFLFLALFLTYGARFAAQTERINAAIALWMPRVIKYGAMLLGVVLFLDAAAFFISGSALFTMHRTHAEYS